MKYMGICLASKDLEKTKIFYKQMFGARVISDFGENITLSGGISFQEIDSWSSFLDKEVSQIKFEGNDAELYFEHDDLDEIVSKIREHNVCVLHDVKEHAWGQRGVRFYDPDMHIIEVSETLLTLVKRLKKEGMSIEAIVEKTCLSTKLIERMMKK